MEQKGCSALPPLCAKYPWLVSQTSLEEGEHSEGDQIFFTMHDPLFHYKCRIPELAGNRIRGNFHGWVVLSNNMMWSLWNPMTSTIIHLPSLILEDGDCDKSIKDCCLLSPPDDPESILVLTRTDKSTFVFCRLDHKRWVEMSYDEQLKRLTGDGDLVHSLTCCNGKIYALNSDSSFEGMVIEVDIMVKDREAVIRLFVYALCHVSGNIFVDSVRFLIGYCTQELFCITIFYKEKTKKTIGEVLLHKLDPTSIKWEELKSLKDWDISMLPEEWEGEDALQEPEEWEGEDALQEPEEWEGEACTYDDLNKSCYMWEKIEDLKDCIFFVDLARDCKVFYRPAIESELGGYIHIRSEIGKIIYSYHVKKETITISSMPSLVLPTSYVSVWECYRPEDNHEEAKVDCKQEEDAIVVRSVTDDDVEYDKSYLLNLPFHVLEMLMKFCVGVEYMNFRATCKHCHEAAPLIKWRDESELRRLETYSIDSPWLMVVDAMQGIITFTDPFFGDKYFMKKLDVWIVADRICYSRFGWLLFYAHGYPPELMFYNPFTGGVIRPAQIRYSFTNYFFSAPPTSPDCMVVGFTTEDVYAHFVAREPIWRRLDVDLSGGDYTYYPFSFPTLYGRDIYALNNEGELHVFKDIGKEDNYSSWEKDIARPPKTLCTSPSQRMLTKCDGRFLLIVVGDSGESVEVFKLNNSIKEWEPIDGIGRHMIYISDTTCQCVEAKTPEMENKIYFPHLDLDNGRVVFYSLETRTYGTFNGRDIEENFRRTSYQLLAHAWVEPSWS